MPSLARRLEDEIEARLAGHGFVRHDIPGKAECLETTEGGFAKLRTPRTTKLVKQVNDETEIFLFPGVMRAKGKIRVDPVIGVDNLRLRARMLSTGEEWRNTHSVGHRYLGLLAGWDRLYLEDASQIESIAREVANSAINALPALQKYDSLAKVRELFLEVLDRTGPKGLSVVFAEEKLALTQDN